MWPACQSQPRERFYGESSSPKSERRSCSEPASMLFRSNSLLAKFHKLDKCTIILEEVYKLPSQSFRTVCDATRLSVSTLYYRRLYCDKKPCSANVPVCAVCTIYTRNAEKECCEWVMAMRILHPSVQRMYMCWVTRIVAVVVMRRNIGSSGIMRKPCLIFQNELKGQKQN